MIAPTTPTHRQVTRNLRRSMYLLRCQIVALQERDKDRDLMMECYEVAMIELRAENARMAKLLTMYADISETCEALSIGTEN